VNSGRFEGDISRPLAVEVSVISVAIALILDPNGNCLGSRDISTDISTDS